MVIFYSFLYVYQMVAAYFQTNSFEDVGLSENVGLIFPMIASHFS